MRRAPTSTLFPYTTLFRSWEAILLRTTPLDGRPAIPRDLTSRVHVRTARDGASRSALLARSEEHTSELQSLTNLVCRLLLEKKKREQGHGDQHRCAEKVRV